MSKKEEVLNSLSLWQSYQGKMLTTFIALCGFAFGAAGGVVSVPLWLTAVSMIGVVLIGISVILLHRKIIKLQHELGGVMINIIIATCAMACLCVVLFYIISVDKAKTA